MKDPNTKWFWGAIGLLLLIAVPYAFVGRGNPLILGLPLWVVVSFGASVGIAVLSALVIQARWTLAKHTLEKEKEGE